MHRFANHPAPNRRARARSLTLLAFSIVAVMCSSAGVAVAATEQEPRDAEPSTTQIFNIFYPGLAPHPTGADADNLASTMYSEAIEASRKIDKLPRPMAVPGRFWIIQQLIGLGRRILGNGRGHIYTSVRNFTANSYRADYEDVKSRAPVPTVSVHPPVQVPPPPVPQSGGGGGGSGGHAGSNNGGGGDWFTFGGGFWGNTGSTGGRVDVGEMEIVHQQ